MNNFFVLYFTSIFSTHWLYAQLSDKAIMDLKTGKVEKEFVICLPDNFIKASINN